MVPADETPQAGSDREAVRQFGQALFDMLLSGDAPGLNANSYVRMMPHTTGANVGIFFGLRGRIIPLLAAVLAGGADFHSSAVEAERGSGEVDGSEAFVVALEDLIVDSTCSDIDSLGEEQAGQEQKGRNERELHRI